MKKQFTLIALFFLLSLNLRAQYHFDTLSTSYKGPGVKHTKLLVRDIPWSINVLEVDLKNPYIKIESVKAKDKLEGFERTTSMSLRNTYPGHVVVGAVNGDFYNTGNGVPINTQVKNGEILQKPINLSTLGFDIDGHPMIKRLTYKSTVVAGNASASITSVNTTRGTDNLILYNSYKGANTGTNSYGVEALIRPVSGQWLVNDTLLCVVDTVIAGKGSMPIPAGKAVLSGHGTMQTFINDNIHKGDVIKVYMGLTPGLNKIKEVLGGYPKIVNAGVNYADQGFIEEGGPDHAKNREPRTAAGFSADSSKLYLITLDGRSLASVGATLKELADVMLQLGVAYGINFDGGGSTTMVARQKIMNVSSDPSERAVANGLLVVSTAPQGALKKIELLPKTHNLFKGEAVQFSVETWDEYNNPVALDPAKIKYTVQSGLGSISTTGVFNATNHADTGYVYVRYDSFVDSSLVIVKDISKLVIDPKGVITDTNRILKYRVKAYDIDNNVRPLALNDCKWTLSDPTMGEIDTLGQFRGKKPGNVVVTANYRGLKDTALVTIIAANGSTVISGMDSVGGWTASGFLTMSPGTGVSLSTDIKSTGTGALKVDYKFKYSSMAAKVYLDTDIPITGVPDSILIDARADSAVHTIYYIIADDNNEQFRISPSNNASSAGAFGIVSASMNKISAVGINQFFNYPIRLKRIEIFLGSSKVNGRIYEGSIFLDNLRIKYPEPVTSVITELDNKPGDFELYQNYPNPFNPSTVIEFRTKFSSNVSLKVYDLLGREVSVLVSGNLNAGLHRVNFDASGLTSGVYFYRLQAGNFVETRKMMLVR